MSGFVIACCLIGLAVMGFSIKRRREVNAFMAAELTDFVDTVADEEKEVVEPVWGEKRIVGQLEAIPENVVAIGNEYQSADIATFEKKPALFDEVTRSFLTALDQVLGDQYRAFVNVPVKDFVKELQPGNVPSPSLEQCVSIVISKKTDLSLVCGILLHDHSPRARHQSWLLDNVFTQIGKPLLSFPIENDYSPLEIDEQLDKVMHRSFLNRNCPVCGSDMALKKAQRGKNIGRSFWVCGNFPECKTIVKISS